MDASDHYYSKTVTSRLVYSLGRGAGAIKVVTEAINPLKTGAVIGAVWGGIAALINAGKYGQGKITKREAILDTSGESAGMGLAAGLGLLASNTARASLVVVSASSLIPVTIGFIVTAGAKGIWDYSTKRHRKFEKNQVNPVYPPLAD